MIQTQDINGLLTLIIIIGGILCVPFVWIIIGAPKITRPKQWTIHPDADKLLDLDEFEQKIS